MLCIASSLQILISPFHHFLLDVKLGHPRPLRLFNDWLCLDSFIDDPIFFAGADRTQAREGFLVFINSPKLSPWHFFSWWHLLPLATRINTTTFARRTLDPLVYSKVKSSQSLVGINDHWVRQDGHLS